MHTDEVPVIDPNEDLSQILPIQQKRTIAFINHFIMQTVSYLNNFAQSCESRFMEFEYKIQKIEASLLILESQLASINGLDNLEITKDGSKTENITSNQSTGEVDLPEIESKPNIDGVSEEAAVKTNSEVPEQQGVKAKDDPRFQKFFKMLQVGVPEPAVKLKMQVEGIDPKILDKPDEVVPGLTAEANS